LTQHKNQCILLKQRIEDGDNSVSLVAWSHCRNCNVFRKKPSGSKESL
jgi:hypothetical protein